MLLKNGSTGNYVMYLQYGLHIMCCPPGSFDSKFGSGTENAVKKYQADAVIVAMMKVLPKMALLAMVHGTHW